jgi:hypothetical protein
MIVVDTSQLAVWYIGSTKDTHVHHVEYMDWQSSYASQLLAELVHNNYITCACMAHLVNLSILP